MLLFTSLARREGGFFEPLVLAGEPVLTVPGADALLSEPTSEGCAGLAVRTSEGRVLPVIEATR